MRGFVIRGLTSKGNFAIRENIDYEMKAFKTLSAINRMKMNKVWQKEIKEVKGCISWTWIQNVNSERLIDISMTDIMEHIDYMMEIDNIIKGKDYVLELLK